MMTARSAHRRPGQRRPGGLPWAARGPAFADHGGHIRLGPGAVRRRAGPARANRRRIAPRRKVMAYIRRELRGRRLGRAVRPVVDVGGRGHDHHHEGDHEHQHSGGSGEARRLRALPAYHGGHLSYPVSPISPVPCTSTVGIGRQKIRRCGAPNVIGGVPPGRRWPGCPAGGRRGHRAHLGNGAKEFRCALPHLRLTVNDYPTWAYPEATADEDKLLLLEHADDSAVTVLAQEGDYEGLQLQGPDGEWIPIPIIPGALQVFSGHLLARWTGGRLRPGRHRVVAGGTVTRRSTAVFVYPRSEEH